MSVIEKIEKIISEYDKDKGNLSEYAKGRLSAYKLVLELLKEVKK